MTAQYEFPRRPIQVSDLGGHLQTGFIPLGLSDWLIISSNDIPAIAVASKNGGKLASDTDPSLARVNAATDKKQRIAWASSSSVEIARDLVYPPDLDDAYPIVFHVLAAMADVTDTPVLSIGFFEGVGDTNAGGDTAAVTGTAVAEYTVTISQVDVGAYPNAVSLSIIPGSHTTDALYVYATWLTYTRRS